VDDTKEFLKKYWPYVVGGIIGLWLILRYSGGGSSGGGGADGAYAAYLQAQTAAAAQNAQLGMQQQAQQAQINLANKQLDVENNANYATAFNNFQTTQAQMAAALGGSVAQVVGALNNPAITAIQAAALENSAALQAAGNVAANSFLAQGTVSKGTSQMFSNAISSLGSLGNFSQPKQASKLSGYIDQGIRGYSAYASGGMSEMGREDPTNYDYSSASNSQRNPRLSSQDLGYYQP
jgi:hypothetical protein